MPFPLLYEINTRCWLALLSASHRKPITLATVPDSEFARWQRLGFTHLWLMGVWATGERSRAEAVAFLKSQPDYAEALADPGRFAVGGSPYAIEEYRVPNGLGGDTGLGTFRKRLGDHGLRLILDFVPNHVGLDHRWLRDRPGLFVRSPVEAPGTFAQRTPAGLEWIAHGRDPYFSGWSDTAQLDYRLAETRAAMQSQLLEVAGRCDGVRCDMAMLELNDVFEKTWAAFPPVGQTAGDGASVTAEFWKEAISATRALHPGFLFVAEVYWGLEARLQSLGFDYTYDKELYDALARRDGRGAQQRLLAEAPEFVCSSVHFLENHDEPRIASILSPAEQRAAALSILSLPGMRFLHEGQMEGARTRIPVQFARWPREAADGAIGRLYEELLSALRRSSAGSGQASILKPREAWPGNPTAQNFVLVHWQAEPPDFDLAVINLAPHRGQCYAPLPGSELGRHDWVMSDLLGSEEHERSGSELQSRGLYLDVPEHAAQLFHFRPVRARTDPAGGAAAAAGQIQETMEK